MLEAERKLDSLLQFPICLIVHHSCIVTGIKRDALEHD